MPTIKANNIEVYYEIHGDGEPLILIGGLGTDTSVWTAVLEQLMKHYQVIIFDSRGAGKTETTEPPYTTEQLAIDVACLMDELEIEKAHILGHSLGSAVAQILALEYADKVDKLIICGTFDKLNHVSYCAVKSSTELLQAGLSMNLLVQNNIPWIYSSEFIADPKKLKILLERASNNPNPQKPAGIEGQAQAVLDHDTRERLSHIKHPTLLVSGRDDIITPAKGAKAMMQKIEGSKHVVIEDTAHLFIVEKPLEFTKVVLEFLK